jgi:quercetin 2,3-dioxygenase
LGQSARQPENDSAALSGCEGHRDISEVIDDDGTKVRVIVGEFWGKRGPVDGIAADPQYLDISVPPGVRKTFKVDTYRRAFAYVFAGSGAFADASQSQQACCWKKR